MSRSRPWWGWVGPFALVVGAGCSCGPSRDSLETTKDRSALSQKEPSLASDSAALLRADLPGVQLGMDLSALRAVRPRLERQASADREQLAAYEEQLGPKQRALYFLGGSVPRLTRVQVATELAGLSSVGERVLGLQQRLGAPSGVWDCPRASGQLPTRRYSYRRGTAAASDIFAIVGERVLATYYVASSQQLRASLEQAHCVPTPPERATRFPALPIER